MPWLGIVHPVVDPSIEVLTLTGDSYRTRQRRELLARENRASRD
ncbi:hypothetical protein [Kitasatospora terrestris]